MINLLKVDVLSELIKPSTSTLQTICWSEATLGTYIKFFVEKMDKNKEKK